MNLHLYLILYMNLHIQSLSWPGNARRLRLKPDNKPCVSSSQLHLQPTEPTTYGHLQRTVLHLPTLGAHIIFLQPDRLGPGVQSHPHHLGFFRTTASVACVEKGTRFTSLPPSNNPHKVKLSYTLHTTEWLNNKGRDKWKHVPFSLTDLSQCKQKLGWFSEDSSKFAEVFHALTLAYDLTWKDVQVVIPTCSTPEKKTENLDSSPGFTLTSLPETKQNILL